MLEKQSPLYKLNKLLLAKDIFTNLGLAMINNMRKG
jgi:hypothetical protein